MYSSKKTRRDKSCLILSVKNALRSLNSALRPKRFATPALKYSSFPTNVCQLTGNPNPFSGFGWLIETGLYDYFVNLFDGAVYHLYLSDVFLKLKTWQYLGLVYDYDAGSRNKLFHIS
jgi:hypothetical protein